MPIFGGLGQGNRCANHYFTNLLDHDCDVYGSEIQRAILKGAKKRLESTFLQMLRYHESMTDIYYSLHGANDKGPLVNGSYSQFRKCGVNFCKIHRPLTSDKRIQRSHIISHFKSEVKSH